MSVTRTTIQNDRTFHCLPKMASKVLNRFRTVCKTGHLLVPNRNPPLKYPILTASQSTLHSRSYSDHPNKKSGAPVSSTSSLNEAELIKFSAIAETCKGPNSPRPFEGLKVVDVGCGGGILSEPLAHLGATVMGVDALDKNIKIARLHADLDPMTSSIEYRCTTAEKLVEEQREFDAVIASEVIEHVADPAEFCKSLSALTVSHGATVISTINRSMRSYATAIIVAEYLLHWLPKGAHEWSSFLTPEELVLILQRASISKMIPDGLQGLSG